MRDGLLSDLDGHRKHEHAEYRLIESNRVGAGKYPGADLSLGQGPRRPQGVSAGQHAGFRAA
jgi:hypothetical protein